MAHGTPINPFGLFLFILMGGLLGVTSYAAARMEMSLAVILAIGTAVAVIAFFRTRLAIYLLIFSMLLSPEFGAGGMATGGATLGRGVTFRFDDLLLVLVGITWLIKSAIYKELGIFRRTPLNGAMSFYIFACGLATLIGISAGRVQAATGALFVIKYIQYFVLFFMVINNIHEEKDIRRYWLAVLMTAVIVATIGIAQIPSGERVTAPFEGDEPEPNTFGGYLAFLVLICTALAFTMKKRQERWAYAALSTYLFIPFLFTLSRASYLGLIPGLIVVLFLTRNHLVSYLLLAGALFVVLFPALLPEVIRDRVAFTWSQEARRGQAVVLGQRLDTSTSARLESFDSAIQAFWEKPLVGYGVTGWRFIDSQYFRTLTETGLVGMLSLFYLVLRLFQLARDRIRYFSGNSFFRGLSIGFLAGLICLLFHAIGSNTFIIVRIMEPFWLTTALLFMSRFVAHGQVSVTAGGLKRDVPEAA